MQRYTDPKATSDAAFKTGAVLIEGEYAFFKFDKVLRQTKSKKLEI
jgi:hypothetical protein